MRFEISRRPEWFEESWGVEHLVEKVLGDGERILLASFKEEGPAIAMLALVAASAEVEKGAKVAYGEWTT